MLSGAPGRGTELTAMTYRNTRTRPTRNLVILGKHVTMLCMYQKTSAITGKDKMIPHSLDAVTSDVLIQDLSLARAFAEFAAHTCFPDKPEIKEMHCNQLFVNYQKLFNSNDLSAIMTRCSLPFIQYGLTINSWRHIQTAWKRKFRCSVDDLLEEDAEDNVEALQAGHSRATENRIYGLSMQALAGAAEDILPQFLQASVHWQITCKTVPGGKLLAYTQARSYHFDQLQSSKANLLAKDNMRSTAYTATMPSVTLPTAEEVASKVLDQLSPMLNAIMQKLDSMDKAIISKSNIQETKETKDDDDDDDDDLYVSYAEYEELSKTKSQEGNENFY
jgi:hypothetical protein